MNVSAISDLLSYWQVSYVVAAIQAGAVGTQACNEAIATIQSIVGDLETTAMFCTAGALNPEGKVGVFHEHRYVHGAMVLAANYTKKVVVVFSNCFSMRVCVCRVNILETAKQLVEDTKRLVSSAAGSQEQLAAAALNAVKTITNEVQESSHVTNLFIGMLRNIALSIILDQELFTVEKILYTCTLYRNKKTKFHLIRDCKIIEISLN